MFDFYTDGIDNISLPLAARYLVWFSMSNHYHVILHVNQSKIHQWDNLEIAKRWIKLFKGNELASRWLSGEILDPHEHKVLDERIIEWRKRLADISWFMRCLNEPIAREANQEDKCTGRFWEGRFKSQALLDEAALLTCMVYVDLNPIRAGIANNLMESDFTSIQERLAEYKESQENNKNTQAVLHSTVKNGLLAFMEREVDDDNHSGMPFSLKEYIQLVDWSGRAVRNGKKGIIPEHIAPVLTVLSINRKEWLNAVKHFGHRFPKVAGHIDSIKHYCRRFNQRFVKRQNSNLSFYTI